MDPITTLPVRRYRWWLAACGVVIALGVYTTRWAGSMPAPDPLASTTADDRNLQTILAVHPDALAVTASSGFQTWLKQDAQRLAVLERGDPNETVALISFYKTALTRTP